MKRFIGDKWFYISTLTLVIPMILQNLITSFVSMLDNIMVGQLGTMPMSGVSIVNQFIFIFNITIFGTVSGPSIFGAQFYGKGDDKGQRDTFRFRLFLVSIIILISACVFSVFKTELISLFLSKTDTPDAIAATLAYGKEYMSVMVLSLIPYGICQAYASVLRECGHTKIPMYGALTAVGVNLLLDYSLIFGHFGLPALGVTGAAWATVIAKVIEALVVIIWAHSHPDKNKYIVGLYKDWHIPKELRLQMTQKSIPLLVNEFLWVIGMSVVAVCYAVRGLDVVAARNVASTMTNLFTVVYVQMGACISIIIGPVLGRGEHKEARSLSDRLLFLCIIVGVLLTLGILPLSRVFPQLYNTESQVRDLAAFMIVITGLSMPLYSYSNGCYFTLRSGGRTGITFLFDFIFTWCIMIPMALILSYFTRMDIHLIFALVTMSEVIKAIIGFFMVRSNMWIRTIVN